MKLLLENLPPSLLPHARALQECLDAFDEVMAVQKVYLFGSHARGVARPDSDVDLCIVSHGAANQMEAAQRFRHVMWDVWPRPSFTLIPITPERLAEKQACGDHFFRSVLQEGIELASEDRLQ
jgi:hypothetical protein